MSNVANDTMIRKSAADLSPAELAERQRELEITDANVLEEAASRGITAGQALIDLVNDRSKYEQPDPLEATATEKKLIADYEASQAKLVELAVSTLDPKDMLKKYAKMGAEALKLASKRKASFKAWAEEDYKKVCDQTDELIRMRVPIKDVRIDTYVRIHLFVEAAKLLVPGVEKLSYHQVRYKLLSTLSFSAVDLTGEIKKGWITWVQTTVEKQLSDKPFTMKELDASIDEREKEIEEERKARDKRSPEAVLEAEQKAADRKIRKARQTAQTKVLNAISESFEDKTADVNDIVDVVRKAVAESTKEEMRRGLVVFDASQIDTDECKQLVAVMANAGKLAEMKFLRDNLDRMIKMAENAMITSKTA